MRDKRTMYLIWKKKWANFCLQITATSFRYSISRFSLLTKAFCHFSLGIVAVSLGKSSEMENLAFLNFIQFFKIFFLSLQYENWATIGRNLFLFLFSVRCANSMFSPTANLQVSQFHICLNRTWWLCYLDNV